MSADAKLWTNEAGEWCGLHGGQCLNDHHADHYSPWDLRDALADIEACMGHRLRWEFRVYPDGQAGLVGYVA